MSFRAATSPHLSHNASRIYQEGTSERNALRLYKHTVVLAQLVVLVAEQRYVDPSEPAVFLAGIVPSQQAVFRVGGREHDGGVPGFEVCYSVAERDDLSWTHECPGHWDEGKD